VNDTKGMIMYQSEYLKDLMKENGDIKIEI